MQSFKLIISAIALALTMPVCGQTTQKLSTGKTNDYGLTYSLPTTVFDITFEVKHTVTAPGEFWNYAKLYLDIDNIIVDATHETSISGVYVNTRGIANPNEAWLSKFKSGANVTMLLTEGDVPLAINLDDITPIKSVSIPSAKQPTPTPLETPEARQAITQEMSAATSLSKKAQLAAQRIFELRETRNELLSGSAETMPPDGKAMELILSNIAAQEAALTAMFTGTVSEYTTVTTITYTPRRDAPTTKIIARLSPTMGLVDADDLSGEPITLSLSDVVEGKIPVNEKGEPKTFPKGGVAYAIPGAASLSISFDGKKLFTHNYDIAQFGFVFGLEPAQFTDKKNPAFVEFSPITGAIVRLGTTPIAK